MTLNCRREDGRREKCGHDEYEKLPEVEDV